MSAPYLAFQPEGVELAGEVVVVTTGAVVVDDGDVDDVVCDVPA
jgi:hypothetical protein